MPPTPAQGDGDESNLFETESNLGIARFVHKMGADGSVPKTSMVCARRRSRACLWRSIRRAAARLAIDRPDRCRVSGSNGCYRHRHAGERRVGKGRQPTLLGADGSWLYSLVLQSSGMV